MDRFTDVVELLVEHATDFRMCDLLDENFPAGSSSKYNSRKSGSDAVSLGLIPGKWTSFRIYRSVELFATNLYVTPLHGCFIHPTSNHVNPSIKRQQS